MARLTADADYQSNLPSSFSSAFGELAQPLTCQVDLLVGER